MSTSSYHLADILTNMYVYFEIPSSGYFNKPACLSTELLSSGYFIKPVCFSTELPSSGYFNKPVCLLSYHLADKLRNQGLYFHRALLLRRRRMAHQHYTRIPFLFCILHGQRHIQKAWNKCCQHSKKNCKHNFFTQHRNMILNNNNFYISHFWKNFVKTL